MNRRHIFKFHAYFAREGSLSGIFTATEADVAGMIGKEVRFGEVLGKHSDVRGSLEEGDFTKIETGEDVVEMFEKLELGVGYNPLDYYKAEETEG